MKLLSFVIFLAALYEIHAGASKLCGKNLIQALDLVCVNGFNDLGINKKSIKKPSKYNAINKMFRNRLTLFHFTVNHDLDALSVFNEIEDESPFKSESLLNDMLFSERLNTLAKTRRHRLVTGVYDECCLKSCTTKELSGYCL